VYTAIAALFETVVFRRPCLSPCQSPGLASTPQPLTARRRARTSSMRAAAVRRTPPASCSSRSKRERRGPAGMAAHASKAASAASRSDAHPPRPPPQPQPPACTQRWKWRSHVARWASGSYGRTNTGRKEARQARRRQGSAHPKAMPGGRGGGGGAGSVRDKVSSLCTAASVPPAVARLQQLAQRHASCGVGEHRVGYEGHPARSHCAPPRKSRSSSHPAWKARAAMASYPGAGRAARPALSATHGHTQTEETEHGQAVVEGQRRVHVAGVRELTCLPVQSTCIP